MWPKRPALWPPRVLGGHGFGHPEHERAESWAANPWATQRRDRAASPLATQKPRQQGLWLPRQRAPGRPLLWLPSPPGGQPFGRPEWARRQAICPPLEQKIPSRPTFGRLIRSPTHPQCEWEPPRNMGKTSPSTMPPTKRDLSYKNRSNRSLNPKLAFFLRKVINPPLSPKMLLNQGKTREK